MLKIEMIRFLGFHRVSLEMMMKRRGYTARIF